MNELTEGYMEDDIIALAYEHDGINYAEEILFILDNNIGKFWVRYEGKVLRSFVCYITDYSMLHDIVYVTDKYNTYTLDTYRLMKKIHKNSSKDIYSTITTNHTMMAKFAKANKGYLIGDTLIFPKEKE